MAKLAIIESTVSKYENSISVFLIVKFLASINTAALFHFLHINRMALRLKIYFDHCVRNFQLSAQQWGLGFLLVFMKRLLNLSRYHWRGLLNFLQLFIQFFLVKVVLFTQVFLRPMRLLLYCACVRVCLNFLVV